MASHSPTPTEPDEARTEQESYLRGWATLTEMMRGGTSWSGHERNNCYVNLGNGRFGDASSVSGLDFADDGRAVAVTDWDGDGDVDLWLKNRTGPQLRFMHNTADPDDRSWIAFELVGKRSNRDAVGARVAVTLDDGTLLTRSVVAGDGYLSQSSRRVHVGLAGRGEIRHVSITWPTASRGEQGEARGLSEHLGPLEPGRLYRVTEGDSRPEPVPGRRDVAIDGPPADAAELPAASRILLKEPLPLPPELREALGAAPGRTTLVALWAHWCEPCYAELGELASALPRLEVAGVAPVAVSIDPPEDRDAAAELFARRIAPRTRGAGRIAELGLDQPGLDTLEVLLRHVLDRHDRLTLPTSLLVDSHGALQMIYLGAVAPRQVVEDARLWASEEALPAHRRGLGGGRWYFRTPRSWDGLAEDLREAGRPEPARFYEALAGRARTAGGAAR